MPRRIRGNSELRSQRASVFVIARGADQCLRVQSVLDAALCGTMRVLPQVMGTRTSTRCQSPIDGVTNRCESACYRADPLDVWLAGTHVLVDQWRSERSPIPGGTSASASLLLGNSETSLNKTPSGPNRSNVRQLQGRLRIMAMSSSRP